MKPIIPAKIPYYSSKSFWLWTGFFLVLVSLAIFSTYATMKGNKQLETLRQSTPANPSAPPPVHLMELIIGGQPYYLGQETLPVLSPALTASLHQQQAKLLAQFTQSLDKTLTAAFFSAQNKVPKFADWYYSLTGEYTRLATAVTGNMAEYLGNQLQQQVFAGLDEQLDQGLQQLNAEASAQLKQQHMQFIQNFQQLIRQHGGTTELNPLQSYKITENTNLDTIWQQMDISDSMIERQVASGLSALGIFATVTIGKGIGTVVVKQTLAKTIGTKSFQMAAALAAKTATKTAVKSGSALEAGTAGVAICSPTGPIALLCGGIAGIITWVTVDKLFLETDEALHRDKFEQDIQNTLQEQKNHLQQQLAEAYKKVIESYYAQWLKPLQSTSPILPPPDNFKITD